MTDLDALVTRSVNVPRSLSAATIRPYLEDSADIEEQERAIAIVRRVAKASPGSVIELDDILSQHLHNQSTTKLHGESYRIFSYLAEQYPSTATRHIEQGVETLNTENAWIRANILQMFAGVANSEPEALNPHLDLIYDRVTDRNELVRTQALAAVEAITSTSHVNLPQSVVDVLQLYTTGNMDPAPEGGPVEEQPEQRKLAERALYNSGYSV